MVKKAVYSESDFKTVLNCSRLYHLNGSIYNLDISQKFLRYSLRLLIINMIKGVEDIDLLINNCVNSAYNKTYSSSPQHQDTIIDLKSYAFTFLNNFLNLFSAKTYSLVSGPNKPLVNLKEIDLKLDIEAIYKQNNRQGFLHAVVFYPRLDEHVIASDITLKAKVLYLKNFASFSKSKDKYSEVTLHLVLLPKFNKYKAKHSAHSFVSKTYNATSKDIDEIYLYEELFLLNIKNELPLPYCSNFSCSHRKVCNV